MKEENLLDLVYEDEDDEEFSIVLTSKQRDGLSYLIDNIQENKLKYKHLCDCHTIKNDYDICSFCDFVFNVCL